MERWAVSTELEWIQELGKPNHANEIGKVLYFQIFWGTYNKFYMEKFKDVYGIKKSPYALGIIDEHHSEYKERAQNFYEKVKYEFLESFKKINSDGIDRDHVDNLQDGYKGCPIYYREGEDGLEHFLHVIYRIRCNFSHGNMEPKDGNDLNLIVWTYDCLGKLLHAVDKQRFPRE
jgi:hypothetical protein